MKQRPPDVSQLAYLALAAEHELGGVESRIWFFVQRSGSLESL